MSIRKFVATATVLAGALAAGTVHAGPDVQWQVTIETPKIRLPGHVVLPLPPIPVPRAVVVAPQADTRTYAPVYGQVYAQGYGHGDQRRWDADGDGIPNRYDRVYNPRWDRDGDGIPNRYDAYPNDPRNGRGWRERDDVRRGDHWRDERREDRRDDRKDWRDDRRH
jgi:hypothetical protein